MTEINKQIIKEALGKVTQGKWLHVNHSDSVELVSDDQPIICSCNKQCNSTNNASFIASAPDYIRYLLAENERLEIENLGHGYALDVLRRTCELPSGESYQEVDAYIAKLEKVVEAAKKISAAGATLSHTTVICEHNGQYFKSFRESNMEFKQALSELEGGNE